MVMLRAREVDAPAPARSSPSPRQVLRSDVWKMFVTFGTLLALVFSFLAVTKSGGRTSTTAGGPLEVRLADLKIDPAELHAEPGNVVLHVTNTGATQHNLAIQETGKSLQMLDPGASGTLDLGRLAAGTYHLFCQVPGHAAAGMRALLTVEGGSGAAMTSAQTMSPAQMDASYLAGIKSFPAKTKGMGGQPLAPTFVNGVKVFDLTASRIKWETAPGEVHDAMAYNGQVPGPLIHVKLGDRVRVVLHNQLGESTAIHFHGLELPNDQDGVPGITEPLLESGQTKAYEFTVKNSGTHIYHSHMNGSQQVPMGLFGAFIVDGRSEPKADVDVPIILNDGPLGFTINGKSFPATVPIVAAPGQTVRVRYLNEGLQGHPMHMHGMVQTVIAEDGYPVPNPYKLDTIWVGPGQRFDTLFIARPGIWAFHCHILAHAENEKGMFGMVTAVVVK